MRDSAQRAVVLLSGGLDSSTCLAWALDRYGLVETVGFAYGQRHAIEMECRAPLRQGISGQHPRKWGRRLGADHIVDMATSLSGIGATALTTQTAFAMSADGLPNPFVPGRNLLFLTYAAAIAYRRGLRRIVTGVC